MAKHNDMPELNSAKVFLTTLFPKERHNPHCRHQSSASNNPHPRHHAFQTSLPAQQRYSLEQSRWQVEAQNPPKPGYCSPATGLRENSNKNDFTVDGFTHTGYWFKDEPTNAAQSIGRLPS